VGRRDGGVLLLDEPGRVWMVDQLGEGGELT